MVQIGGFLRVDADEPDLERGINWKEINARKKKKTATMERNTKQKQEPKGLTIVPVVLG